MAKKLDRAFAADAAARFDALPLDAQPKWGTLSRDGVITHLVGAFDYTMGRVEQLPPQTGLPFARFVGWLLVSGFISIPKNVKFKAKDGNVAPPIRTEGGIERLREVMEEFIVLMDETDEIPAEHPMFGRFSNPQWLSFHRIHLEHHLKQFGA